MALSTDDMEGSRGGDEDDEEEIDNDDLEETMASLSNKDVRKFLSTLSMDEAIALARECVLEAHGDELKTHGDENQSSGGTIGIGMGGALLRPSLPTAKILKF